MQIKVTLFLIVCFFNFAFSLKAQAPDSTLYKAAERMLGQYGGDTIKNGFDEFSYLYFKELREKSSFFNTYDSLKVGSIIYPQDSSFRLISWQAQLPSGKCLYNAALQTKDTLFIFQLKETVNKLPEFANMKLNPALFYSCLFYNIKEFKRNRKSYYLVFGFQQPDLITKRKYMDVLWFDNGKPVFGEPVFCKGKKDEICVSRVMLEYVADAKVKLNYDEEYKKVIFDHLIKIVSPSWKNEMVNGPDGSYEAYEYKNGHWKYIEMLWHDMQDVPPTDIPKDEKPKKNLFGK